MESNASFFTSKMVKSTISLLRYNLVKEDLNHIGNKGCKFLSKTEMDNLTTISLGLF